MNQRRFFLTSLVVHTALLAWMLFGPKPTFTPNEPVTIEIVDAPRPTDVDKNKLEDKAHKIVDQDEEALNDEISDSAEFLSRHNQVVKKQTISQNTGEFRNLKKAGGPRILSLSELQPKMDIAQMAREQARKDKLVEDGVLPIPKPKAPAVAENSPQQNPSQQASDGQASQSLDYIKNIDKGLETLLTTKEFVFYTYFSRIRNQISQYWGPKVKEKVAQIYKAGRSIASSDDKITHCLVTLDKAGNLLRIQVIGDSGIKELDEAAVEAFHAAAPFPNPPKGIVDPDGNIKIKWDFILEA